MAEVTVVFLVAAANRDNFDFWIAKPGRGAKVLLGFAKTFSALRFFGDRE
jgi:hypothetical protein